MDTEQEKIEALRDQEVLTEWLAHPGTQIIAQKLRIVARAAFVKQGRVDPFKHPGEIMKARQLHYVITFELPRIIEGMVNYDPEAPDKRLAPDDQWRIVTWLKELFKRRKAGKEGNNE